MFIIFWIAKDQEITMLLQKLFFILISASQIHQYATSLHIKEITKLQNQLNTIEKSVEFKQPLLELISNISNAQHKFQNILKNKQFLDDYKTEGEFDDGSGYGSKKIITMATEPDSGSGTGLSLFDEKIMVDNGCNKYDRVPTEIGTLMEESIQIENDILTEPTETRSESSSNGHDSTTTTTNLFTFTRTGRHERIAPNLPQEEDINNLYQLNESKIIFAKLLQYIKMAFKINPTLQPFYYLFQHYDNDGEFSINFIIGTFVIGIIIPDDFQNNQDKDWLEINHLRPSGDYEIYIGAD